MGTYAYGEKAAYALARALNERPDNAYIEGRACWRLSDLRGKAKDWWSSYKRTRDNGQSLIATTAARYGCDAEIVGSDMYIYRKSMLERARKMAATRATEPSDQWSYYYVNPTPDILRRVVRMPAEKAGLILGLGDTVVAAAFCHPPKSIKCTPSASPGQRNRYASAHILDCIVPPYDKPWQKHRNKVAIEDVEARKAMAASRFNLAKRFPFRASVRHDQFDEVVSIVAQLPRSHGWCGRELYMSKNAAAIVAKTIRVVRHKQAA